MKLKPMHSKVMVEQIPAGVVNLASSRGLIIGNKGRVIAIGPDVQQVKVGDVVVMSPLAVAADPCGGTLDLKDFFLIDEANLAAIIEDYEPPSGIIGANVN